MSPERPGFDRDDTPGAVPDEPYDSLARRILPAYGIDRDTPLELLNLSENATYRVHVGQGAAPHILRVHRPDYHTAAEIRSELAWVAALRNDTEIATPEPIPALDGRLVVSVDPLTAGGERRHAVLFHLIPGDAPDENVPTPQFERLGEITARLHRHAETWTPPAGFTRMRWDLAAMLGTHAPWGRWQDGPGATGEVRRVLADTEAIIRQRLRRYGTRPSRFGLIHADLRLANLLVHGDRTAVIDFDDCGSGWFLYDLAAALTFLEDTPQVPDLIEGWLTGYRRVRALTTEDENEIPTFIMLRRLMVVAWLGSHPDTDLARAKGAAFTRASAELADGYLGTQNRWWRARRTTAIDLPTAD
ncbi:phosphotransferase [Embleya sp. NBC_00888]|uniref:phosphotransferase enzyme family protein n=1 Tax=Embleya sp. NBC_00888 TaxID=2975960 RepID=UPI00386C9A2C|nr:phosphotransferase [Embleya sp. NBC_00888]